MARMPNTISAEERREVHKAKMAGKKFNREVGLCDVGFAPSKAGWRSVARSANRRRGFA